MKEFYDQKKTVFIHELGHFISDQNLFEKNGLSKPFEIELFWNDKEKVFGGVCRSQKPKRQKLLSNDIVEVGQLLNINYGCIFQSVLHKNKKRTG